MDFEYYASYIGRTSRFALAVGDSKSVFSGDGIRAQLTQAAKPGKQTIGSGPCPAAWTVIDSPNLGSENNYLSAVEAVSDSDIWAVGQAGEFDSY